MGIHSCYTFKAIFQSEMPQNSIFWYLIFKISLGGACPQTPLEGEHAFIHYKCLPTTPPPFNLPPNKWPDQLLIACATSAVSQACIFPEH